MTGQTASTAAAGPLTSAGAHKVKPLSFNPASLAGLSEKLIVSHHDNNYAGAVKNLNKTEEELGKTSKDTPTLVLGGLKERELTYTNSMILHEFYFGNLGGNGQLRGPVEQEIIASYGTSARWEEQFRQTAASLYGGSGWVVLEYNFHSADVRHYWSSGHTQALSWGQPLLVLDMFEHAYQMDYGAAAAKYVDAFWENIHWDEVNRRLAQAKQVAALLR